MNYIFYSFYCFNTVLAKLTPKSARENAFLFFSITGMFYSFLLGFYSGLFKLLYGTHYDYGIYLMGLLWFGISYIYFLKSGKGIEIVDYYNETRGDKRKRDALVGIVLFFSSLILLVLLSYLSNTFNYKPFLFL